MSCNPPPRNNETSPPAARERQAAALVPAPATPSTQTDGADAQRLAALLSAVPGWILSIDLEDNITYLNRPLGSSSPSVCEMEDQASAAEAIGTSLSQYFTAETREVAMILCQAAKQESQPAAMEVRLAESPETPMTMSVQPMLESGRVVGVSVMLSDISQLKRLEGERRSLQGRIDRFHKMESLGVLAGGVAHDFNNLLVGVLGNADLLRQQAQPGSTAHELACGIEQAARRASDLCDQMLAYAGQSKIEPSEIDLSHIVDDLVPVLRDRIDPSATLKLRLSSDLPTFRGDPSQIQRVALNLIANASDALREPGGVIRVSTGKRRLGTEQLIRARIGSYLPSGEYVVLEVEDEGEGIATENVSRIFEPFYSTRFAGRGLGLAAAHGIVKAHGGGLQVDSKPGEGTLVQVLFPVQSKILPITQERPAVVDREEYAQLARPSGPGRRVLVAEGDPARRERARVRLEGAGFEVVLAEDGGEAFRSFAADPSAFGLLILDLTMAKLNGDELLAAVRQRSKHVPVALCSELSRDDLLDRLRPDPNLHFLQKPYRESRLLELARMAITPAPTPSS